MMMSMPLDPDEFKVDHPFVFFLVERNANGLNVLFQGRVLEPKL